MLPQQFEFKTPTQHPTTAHSSKNLPQIYCKELKEARNLLQRVQKTCHPIYYARFRQEEHERYVEERNAVGEL
jgi:hypothetical protein